MPILDKSRYDEYEAFVKNHYKGHFMQAPCWASTKEPWENEIVISEDVQGNINGAMSLLIRKTSRTPCTLMYSPRGPVCGIYDTDTIKKMTDEAKEIAKKHKSYVLRIDPDVIVDDERFIKIMNEIGYRPIMNRDYRQLQPRYVFRLDLKDKTADEIFEAFHSKTRYNVRLAQKKGCEVRIGKREDLPAFRKILVETGTRDGFAARSIEYLEKMYDEMIDKDYIRLYLVYYNEQPISGALTIFYGNKAYYLYGASSNEFRKVMPNYLMQWEMIQESINRGCDIYDFRGVLGDKGDGQILEGLYRFKKGFNADFLEFATPQEYILNPFWYNIIERGNKILNKIRK